LFKIFRVTGFSPLEPKFLLNRTSPVLKVSSHLEYLENRSLGLDVTLQPFRGDLISQPLTVTLPVGLVSRQ